MKKIIILLLLLSLSSCNTKETIPWKIVDSEFDKLDSITDAKNVVNTINQKQENLEIEIK